MDGDSFLILLKWRTSARDVLLVQSGDIVSHDFVFHLHVYPSQVPLPPHIPSPIPVSEPIYSARVCATSLKAPNPLLVSTLLLLYRDCKPCVQRSSSPDLDGTQYPPRRQNIGPVIDLISSPSIQTTVKTRANVPVPSRSALGLKASDTILQLFFPVLSPRSSTTSS